MTSARGLSPNYLASLAKAIKKKDPAALKEYNDAWKKEHVAVGIAGQSGVGKSSFINRMLGLKSGDKGAAKVGIGDTTLKAREYPHPDNTNLRFWDLPGFGTRTFPSKNYLRTIKIDRYDFFLIMYSTTISENDIQIIKQLIQRGKHFALVRTKIDEVLYDRTRSFEDWIDEVHKKGMTELRKSGINTKAVEIFAISNTQSSGEFGALLEYTVKRMSDIKKTSIYATVKFQTVSMIEDKERLLKTRAKYVAISMGVITGVPIPGVDILLNTKLLQSEIQFYLQTFQLEEENINEITSSSQGRLQLSKEIISTGVQSFITAKLANATAITAAEGAIEYLLPVVGSLITGTVAFTLSYKFLIWMIEGLAEDAKTIASKSTGD